MKGGEVIDEVIVKDLFENPTGAMRRVSDFENPTGAMRRVSDFENPTGAKLSKPEHLWRTSRDVLGKSTIHINMGFPNNSVELRLLLIKQCLGKCYEELGHTVIRVTDQNMEGIDSSTMEELYRILKIRIDTFKVIPSARLGELTCGSCGSCVLNRDLSKSLRESDRYRILEIPRLSALVNPPDSESYQKIRDLMECLSVILRRYQRLNNSFDGRMLSSENSSGAGASQSEYELTFNEKYILTLLQGLPLVLQRTLDDADPSHICYVLNQLSTHISAYLFEGSQNPEGMIITDDPRVTFHRITLITLCFRALDQGLNILGG